MTTCPVPDVTSGVVLVSSTHNRTRDVYPLDTEVTYQCETGYSLKNGTLTRLCTRDGTWTGSAPVCVEELGNDNYISTILIASGSTVLACIFCFFVFLVDFYFYRKKKRKNKISRSQGQIQSGQNRPTSFIISKENHKLMPFYMSPLYREPPANTTEAKLQRTLDKDIHRILDPGGGDASVSRKTSKGKRAKNRRRAMGDLAEVSTQTDGTLLEAGFPDVAATRSGTRKKKKKKHQVGPMAASSEVLQPRSLALNGSLPRMSGHPEHRSVAVPYPGDHYQDVSGWGMPFADPLGGQFIPDVSYHPVPRGRRLPPRPRTNPGGSQSVPVEEEITIVDETAYGSRRRDFPS